MIIVLLGVAVIAAAVIAVINVMSGGAGSSTYYLAGTGEDTDVYEYDDYEQRLFKAGDSIPRGSVIELTGEEYTENGRTYVVIEYEGKEYYVQQDSIVDDINEIVQETVKYVRTSVTVYKSYEGSEIESFVKKGEEVQLKGYDYLESDGSVHMYQIKYGDITGWAYGKYLVDSQEEAEAINEEVYENHKDRAYGSELYGGTTEELDWYPYEKVYFEDNPLLEEARTMYLTEASIEYIDDYLELALENGVNSIVLDFKSGELICPFDIAEELSPTSNAYCTYGYESVLEAVNKIKDAGLYLIARIMVFDDEYYGEDHPEDCIESPEATQLWPSAYSRNVWYYNVALAEEIIEKFGVNEIQFDYVRFPEESYSMSCDEDTDFKNEYDESKAEAVQNFLIYACDQIHKYDVYVSVDVFAESANKYVTAYGQYLPAISNIVDAVSAMPYTDHFGNEDTWSDPYETVYEWAQSCAARQSEIETPAIARTWLTGYSVPWWNPTTTISVDYVEQEAKALYDAGLTGGFMLWNGSAKFSTYENIAASWSYTYEGSEETTETSDTDETETTEDET